MDLFTNLSLCTWSPTTDAIVQHMSYYRDKITLITGSASGLGRALAIQLAALGATVLVSDIDEQKGKSVVNEIGARGEKAQFFTLDVSDSEAFKQVMAKIVADYGRLDLLINNAGYSVNGEVRHVSPEAWQRITEVNFLGVVYGSQLAYLQMIKQKSGQIVNIASGFGLVSAPIASTYIATKHAVVGFSRSLRYEAETFGIQVNTVCPGFIQTSFFDNTTYVGAPKSEMLKQLTFSMISPEKAVSKILRGVQKNKALLLFPFYVWIYLWIYRHAEFLVRWMYKKTIRDYRKLLPKE